MNDDTISRQNLYDKMTKEEAIDVLKHNYPSACFEDLCEAVEVAIQALSAQPEEVIPHRNYKYLSDYWCECGWHLGKKGDVKYCAECGRKMNWNG